MPHIVELRYTLRTVDSLSFHQDVPPLNYSSLDFVFQLLNGVATFRLASPATDEAAARAMVEPFLESYATNANLEARQRQIWFDFDRATWDEDPDPDVIELPNGSRIVRVRPVVIAISVPPVTLRSVRAHYWPAPTHFKATPDVKSMWLRYDACKRGHEPIPSMAYFCLTVAEGIAERERPGRKKARERASVYFNIELEVLHDLGYLTSQVGDAAAARKASRQELRPHTQCELVWIDEVIPRLIRRVGEIAAGASDLQLISRRDFSATLEPRGR